MASKALLETLLADDPRYAEMFAVERESASNGVDNTRDYTTELNALRNQAPVHQGSLRSIIGLPEIQGSMGPDRLSFTFLSFRACEIGFRETAIFSSEKNLESPGLAAIGQTILTTDGKAHRRLRATAQPLFKRPKVLDWWNRRWVAETVDALLNRLGDRTTADLNTELCSRLPMAIVTRAFGLEGADALTFRYHLNLSTFGARGRSPEEVAKSRDYVDRTLRDLIAENRREPGDNLIAGLLAQELKLEDGSTRKLTDEEMMGFCKITIFAGGGTTWRQLAITIDALLNNYHFWEACRDDRSLVDQAVEESIRWRSNTAMMTRVSLAETEVEGMHIPADSRIFLALGYANHDPAVFDRPGDYDIFRKKDHHMGFGFGPHRCIGMDVARQEMIVAINGLMDRWPNLAMDRSQPEPRFVGLEQRGMTAVPVRLK
jgi:cytochrome P450